MSRGTGPVPNRRVHALKLSLSMREALTSGDESPDVRARFIETYVGWIERGKAAPVKGLGAFPHAYYVNGVTQAYDLFFARHAQRRFRTLLGEYPYVRLSVERWLHLEDDPIREGDAVIVSCPHYGDGGVPRGYQELLDTCAALGVPVMIDAAYYGTCYGTRYEFSHPAIEMVGFSLSKAFSVQSFRIGLLLSKCELGCLEEIQVQAGYFNRVGAAVGMRLMRELSADFMAESYRSAQQALCRRLELRPTSCVLLANIDDDDTRFDAIVIDERFEPPRLPPGVKRRICISRYLADGPPTRLDRAGELLRELRRLGPRGALRRYV